MSRYKKSNTINGFLPRADKTIIEKFKVHDVAKISDAMAKYGTLNSKVKPLVSGMKVCGQAVTICVSPGDMSAIEVAASIAQKGDVVVVDAGGYEDFAVAGELVCRYMKEIKGIGGLVADGAVMDKQQIIEMDFPVFSTSVSPVSLGTDGPVAVNVPIKCAGMVVYPGDLVIGDDDGVVIVPWEDLERVLSLTDDLLERELKYQAEIDAGVAMTVLFGCEAKIDKWRA